MTAPVEPVPGAPVPGEGPVGPTPAEPTGGRLRGWVRSGQARRLFSGRFVVGAVILACFGLLALFPTFFAPHNPLEIFPGKRLVPPQSGFWFGTDTNGMDVLSRTIAAARVDLGIALAAVALSLVLGTLIGLVVGYIGGWLDFALQRVLDVLQAFPALILALAIVGATAGGLWAVVVIIGILDTPIFIRVIRSEVLRAKEMLYVDAARVAGNPPRRLLWLHILPNVMAPVIVETATRLSWAIKVTASLAFIGVGITAPTAEWGAMMRQGAGPLINGEWWVALFPGLAVVILVLGINLLTDGVRAYLDPRNS